jgi:hypothetical protein
MGRETTSCSRRRKEQREDTGYEEDRTIVGFAVVGAIIGLRPLARRVGEKMQKHCAEIAAHCMQMAAQFGSHGEPVGRT